MKKIFQNITVFCLLCLALFLTGCTEKKPDDSQTNNNQNQNQNTQIPDEPVKTDLEFLQEAVNALEIPTSLTENYEYIKSFEYNGETISATWVSDKTTSLSNFGVVKRGYNDEEVNLKATFQYKEETLVKIYKIIVPGMPIEVRFNDSLAEIEIPSEVNGNITLLTFFYDEEMKATWTSSHPEIISDTGIYQSPKEHTTVTLTVKLEVGGHSMEKSYEVKTFADPESIKVNHHLVVDDAKDYDKNYLDNCHLEDDVLVLNEGAIEGKYLSNIFEVEPTLSVVASWGALTSKEATAEVEVRVRVNGKWSMFFSYGAWGLGLENKPMATNTNDGMVKISTDEIIVMGGKTAEAIQYRVTLRRNETNIETPKLSFVALAIEYKNYEYKINTSVLPDRVDREVPKLNQNVVPVIGNSICSPTSSTMLLKYKGHNFSAFDEYENRYIANLARDYGNEIFGNWVYCTVIMTSFGERAYVMRMYSLDELKEHLANVEPVALSVKGKMNAYDSDNSYTTGGHLLVCQGYYEKDGQTIFICNDPNVKEVYVEYSEETIARVWRMVAYVIE